MSHIYSAVLFDFDWTARSASLALFTSKRSGFTSPAASPLALGLVSPISVGLLWVRASCVDA